MYGIGSLHFNVIDLFYTGIPSMSPNQLNKYRKDKSWVLIVINKLAIEILRLNYDLFIVLIYN